MQSGSGLVFLDASVLVAASRSPGGGSAAAMEACQGRRFRAALTFAVLLEARWNIAEKFGEPELMRFYNQLAALGPEMLAPPSSAEMDRCVPLTGEKDAHVLAAALEGNSEYLLTLDRHHLITPTILSAGLTVKVVTPGDFLREIALSALR